MFSARLMYSRKSGRSAKPTGTGAQLASGNHVITVRAVLFWDWAKPTIDIEIKGPISGEQTKNIKNLHNSATEDIVGGRL